MAPLRKSTSKQKKTKVAAPASYRVHKHVRAKTTQSGSVDVQREREYDNALDAVNGTKAQNDPVNSAGSVERLNEDTHGFDDGSSDSSRVVIDLTQDSNAEPALDKTEIFPFLKLPSEIRNSVYQELISSGYDIFYEQRIRWGQHDIYVTATDQDGNVYSRPVRRRGDGSARARQHMRSFSLVALNILLINKFIGNEARGKCSAWTQNQDPCLVPRLTHH